MSAASESDDETTYDATTPAAEPVTGTADDLTDVEEQQHKEGLSGDSRNDTGNSSDQARVYNDSPEKLTEQEPVAHLIIEQLDQVSSSKDGSSGSSSDDDSSSGSSSGEDSTVEDRSASSCAFSGGNESGEKHTRKPTSNCQPNTASEQVTFPEIGDNDDEGQTEDVVALQCKKPLRHDYWLPSELWVNICLYSICQDDLGTFKQLAATCSWMRDIVTLLTIKPEPIIHLNSDVIRLLNVQVEASEIIVSLSRVIQYAGSGLFPQASGLCMGLKSFLSSYFKDTSILMLKPVNYGYSGFRITDVRVCCHSLAQFETQNYKTPSPLPSLDGSSEASELPQSEESSADQTIDDDKVYGLSRQCAAWGEGLAHALASTIELPPITSLLSVAVNEALSGDPQNDTGNSSDQTRVYNDSPEKLPEQEPVTSNGSSSDSSSGSSSGDDSSASSYSPSGGSESDERHAPLPTRKRKPTPASEKVTVQELAADNNEGEQIEDAVAARFKEQLRNVTVPIYSNKSDGSRNYQKIDHCYYCKKSLKSGSSDHLLSSHTDRKLVQDVINSKDNKERSVILYKLQNLGNYQHNSQVIEAGSGEIVVLRRPNTATPAWMFAPCILCYGFCHKRALSRHIKTCKLNKDGKKHKSANAFEDGMLLIVPYLPERDEAAVQYTKLLAGMRDPSKSAGVLGIIREDSLLEQYGINQIIRKGTSLSFDDMNQVRGKLRFIGRLLLGVRNDTGTALSCGELLQPQYFDAFKRAAIAIGNENIQLSSTMGIYVKKLCLLNISQSIKSGNTERCDGTKNFLELFNAEWGDTVAAGAIRSLQQKRLNKQFLLPTERDLKTVTKYLEDQIQQEGDYTRLQKLIMTSLILFNKRRPAEVANLKVADYRLSFDNGEDREEILRRLSPEEQLVSKRMHVIEVKGKSTGPNLRGVYILIESQLVTVMDRLLRLRPASYTKTDYVFGRPKSERPYMGTEVVKEIVDSCPDLEYPDRIHAQKMRTYLATACQVLSMNDTETRLLAQHMGHKFNIHVEHYALQTQLLERGKVAKILCAIQNGNLESRPKTEEKKPTHEIALEVQDVIFTKDELSTKETMTCANSEDEQDTQAEENQSRNKEKKSWTEEEIKKLTSVWDLTKKKLPNKQEMEMAAKSLNRSKLVIRSKAQHLLRKLKQ